MYDAVTHFNIGNLVTLLIFDKVNIERGYYTTLGCITDNNCRIQNAKRQSSDGAKTQRRYLREQKKAKVTIHIRMKGEIYSIGNF